MGDSITVNFLILIINMWLCKRTFLFLESTQSSTSNYGKDSMYNVNTNRTDRWHRRRINEDKKYETGISVEGIQELFVLLLRVLWWIRNCIKKKKKNSISTYICMVFLIRKDSYQTVNSGYFWKKVKRKLWCSVFYTSVIFILELKNSVTETKSSPEEYKSRCEQAKGRMSKLEDRAMSTKKGKRIRKSKQSLKDLWDAFKRNKIPLQESQKRKDRKTI